MKVLVADACVGTRARISEALAGLADAQVVGVADVEGALAELALRAPDVVVTAAELDDGDCYDLIAAAHRRPQPPAVIVLDGADLPGHRPRYLAAGAAMVMSRAATGCELQCAVRVVSSAAAARRDELGERFTLIGRVAAGVAHDLNNYLTVIMLALMTAQDGADGKLLRDALGDARHAVESAARLNGNVLAYARGGAPAPGMVDLASLVRRVLDVFGRAISVQVEVIVEVAADLPPVCGVATELEQLLLNLILNARDAMPSGGELRIGARAHGDGVRLEVSDTGHGLDAAVAVASGLLSPSSKPGRPGAGLGLGIVRAVVDRHAGTLEIAPRLGGGTEVTVVLPSCAPAAASLAV
jgi:signal transduction histidine kinase